MSHNPRALNVLESAKTHSKWNKPDTGNFQGISYGDYCNSIQAQVVELSVSSKGKIKIHKITCVIDCGQIVNPHIVHQQIEGAIIFGLTATLHVTGILCLLTILTTSRFVLIAPFSHHHPKTSSCETVPLMLEMISHK